MFHLTIHEPATKLNYSVKRGSVGNIRLLLVPKCCLFCSNDFFSLGGRLIALEG